MKKTIYAFLLAVVSAIGLSSCTDERLWVDDDIIGEGEATISAEVLFKNFTPALDGNASRTAGDALDGIENLYLFVYSADGQELLYNNSFTGEDLDVSNDNKTLPSDGHYEPSGSAVTPTDRATFNCTLPYGRYKIYAVANVRGEENVAKLAADKVGTVADLKKVSFEWNEEDIPENDQMFGFFTTSELGQSASSSFEAPTITVNNSNLKLNAWMRRLASKVTVAFDGTDLKESVYIYIQSVTLHDIPASCTIGKSNTPDALDQLITDGESIIYNEVEENQTRPGLVISKNRKAGSTGHTHEDENSLFFYENNQGIGKNKAQDAVNNNTNGQTEGQPFNPGSGDPDGKIDFPDGNNDDPNTGFKDEKRFGTYIEVKAYYKSENKEKPSEGNIIYRFMLGKNISDNYDAERNYHYKLTLKFKNWANDPDWHIVYDEPTPSVYTPNIYYISYLYNQQMGFPVRIVTGDGESVKNYTLRAEIIANNWGPSEDDPENENDYGDVPEQWIGSTSSRNGFAWNKPVFDGTDAFDGGLNMKNAYSAEEVEIGNGKKIKAGANFVGFLTLRQNENTIVGNGLEYTDPETPAFLQAVYDGEKYTTASGVSNIAITTPRWWAEYKLNNEGRNDVCGNAGDGQYDVTYHTDGSVTANVPMYTRAKEIVPATDFTGNNPYDAYMRLAFVKFTLKDENGNNVKFKNIDDPDGDMITERIVPIYQVRRINNPKAIWRKSESTEPFHIELMQRANETTDKFTTFKSRGPWRAYIIQDPKGIVTLTAAGNQSVKGVMDLDSYDQPTGTNMISGDGGTEIDFTYTPSGADGCAIIRVDYHDYTCHHLIFVRSGYDYGVTLGKATWTCYNAYAATAQALDGGNPKTPIPSSVNVEVTNSPLSIGTFYKRANYNYGLLESNNTKPGLGWLEGTGSYITEALDYINLNSSDDKVTGKIHWNDFGGWAWCSQTTDVTKRWNRATEDYSWAETWIPTNKPDIGNPKLAVPTYDDYFSLIDRDDIYAKDIEFGYGIAYGDGAESVATTMDEAYGYTDYDNDGTESTKGMRVCVVYNKTNGDQILFPLSSVGQGRRARLVADLGNKEWPSPYNLTTGTVGCISYGGVKGVLYGENNGKRPLTYNLYRGAGAVYWFQIPAARKPVLDPDDMCASWDINYGNVVFNHYDSGSLNFNFKKNNNGNWYSDGDTRNNWNSSDALPIKFILKK